MRFRWCRGRQGLPLPRIYYAVGVLLFVAAVASCISTGPDVAQYSRDGVQYGVTKGRFRGRWWNYYERGRSFSDGGFWTEAERDLRAALAGRERDQLWPRTYGLHFLPEYFPHRELGVALYHERRLEEAITELELSLSHRHSARAAYFLNRARKDWVDSEGTDRLPPTIEILSPEPGAVVGNADIELRGIARDDTFVGQVLVDGEELPLDVSGAELPFSYVSRLAPGPNRLVIEATDLAGKSVEVVAEVYCDVDGPTVSVDADQEVPGSIRGVAADGAGVAAVVVGEQEASLHPQPDGTVAFDVALADSGPVSPEGTVAYSSTDAFGNETRGSIRVRANPDASRRTETIAPPASAFDPSQAVARQVRRSTVAASGRIGTMAMGVGMWGLGAAPRESLDWQPLAVRFANLREGQRYLRDEILIALDVSGDTTIEQVQLNGSDLETIPGRSIQYLSRRASLGPGPNRFVATAWDTAGRTSSSEVTIERTHTSVEQRVNQLGVAVMGHVWKGNSPVLADESSYIAAQLQSCLKEHGRFRLVEREGLEPILSEQLLSAALASKESRLQLGNIIPAEAMVIGRVRRDIDTIEIIAEAISTETGLFVARADVAGRADDLIELDVLIEDLALRVVQEFPRVQGEVARLRGESRVPLPRPRLAILEDEWIQNSPLAASEMDEFLSELRRELLLSEWFSVVDRENVEEFLAEQQLAVALGESVSPVATRQLAPADVLVAGAVGRTGSDLSVFTQAVDATSTEVLTTVEVSGAPERLRLLARDVARQLVGALSEMRPQPEPLKVPGSIISTLNTYDRVRESMKYVIFRYGPEVIDPFTNEVLGRETEVVGEALVKAVNKKKSTAEPVCDDQGVFTTPMQVGDFVVTK